MFGVEYLIAAGVAGFVTGAGLVAALAKGRVNEEANLKEMFKRAYFDTITRLRQEFDLTEGLTQELAAQAKLVK